MAILAEKWSKENILLTYLLTSNHIHPLQVENCGSNSRLVVDEYDNVKSGLKGLMWARVTISGPDVGPTLYKCYSNVLCLLVWTQLPANTRHWTSVGLMLGQRRRRWTSIESTSWLLGVLTSVSHQNGIINSAQYSLYCQLEPFNNINYKSH